MTVPLQSEFEVLGQPEISRAGVDEVLVQRAKEVWRASKGQPGRGDEMFFNLALSLRRAGMDFYQIETSLYGAPKNFWRYRPSTVFRYLARGQWHSANGR
jgi:hypothetical protein